MNGRRVMGAVSPRPHLWPPGVSPAALQADSSTSEAPPSCSSTAASPHWSRTKSTD